MREYNTFGYTGSAASGDHYSIAICNFFTLSPCVAAGISNHGGLDDPQYLGSCCRRQTLVERKDGVASVPRRFQPVYERIT